MSLSDVIVRMYKTRKCLILVQLICASLVACLGGCGTYDRFNRTIATFELDKTVYSVGDTITLTLTVSGEDSVRFYENIENTLHVWLQFRVTTSEGRQVLSSNGIEVVNSKPRDRRKIITHHLSEKNPLKLTFIGTLGESDDNTAFALRFPTLNVLSLIQKDAYAKAVALEIRGHLMPIKPHPVDALEDFVGGVRLTIHPQ